MSVAINGVEAPPSQLVAHLVDSGVVGTGTQVEVPALSLRGERAVGWLVVEEEDSNVTDRRCAVLGGAGEVHMVGMLSTVWVYLRDSDAAIPCWARGVAAAAWGRQRTQEALGREREALRAERALWADRLDTAHQWAVDRRHCSEYEDLMEVLGLPGRERDFAMDLTVTLDVRVQATATSSDVATAELTHRDIAEAIRAMDHSELVASINDHTVVDVEEG
jgi:hypothetical protein